jgi:serine O-acetyltransferase
MAPGPRDEPGPTTPADPVGDLEGTVRRTAAALAVTGDDALTKAAAEGLPDRTEAVDWVERTKRLLLTARDPSVLRAELPGLAERLERLLRGVTLPDGDPPQSVAGRFIERLPAIRELLAADVEAAYAGDPAARGYAEIVVAYPSIRAIAIYRIAHELYRLGVPVLPRVMTEHAHDRTGIDIHPGARIGRRFFIDHGTGVVVGETTEIGDDVRLYQGVTLGARSPRHGEVLRGRKRHPTIEDDVTIYAGATILGGETTIGRGSVIGGNVWLTESVLPESRVVAEPPQQRVRQRHDHPGQLRWDI